MHKDELIKKLDTMIDDASRTNLWGTIEINFQSGQPTIIKETRTTNLKAEGNTRGPRTEQR
jgi:hypothetical protein